MVVVSAFLGLSATEWVAVVTGLLAVATFCLGWQTRRSTQAAIDASESAGRSADVAEKALAKAYQPFILPSNVRVARNDGNHPEVEFSLRNVGKGVAGSVAVAVVSFMGPGGTDFGTPEGERDLGIALGPGESYPSGVGGSDGATSSFVPHSQIQGGGTVAMDWNSWWQDLDDRGALGLQVRYTDTSGTRFLTVFRSSDGATLFQDDVQKGRWVAPGNPRWVP